jgi:oxaloacetate decarboxylase alpha subunit
VDGKSFIVRQKRDAEGHLNLTVDGRTFAVGVKPLVETGSTHAVPLPIDPVGEKLDAPMPGTVVKVLFQNGDTVEANATVLIMEALKMQLEIKCRTAGRIRFLVSANTAVHAGAPLAVISGPGKGEK